MSGLSRDEALGLAARYVWWKTPEQAAADLPRLAAQVMELGLFEDAALLAARLGEEALRQVLRQAPAGVFSPRSWAYWHVRLGLTRPGETPPPLPRRRLG